KAADSARDAALVLTLAGAACTAVAPTIAAKLACIAIFGVPAAAFQKLANKLAAAARDPSDPNFTVIAQPVVHSVSQQPISTSEGATQQEADALNVLLTNWEQAIGITEALLTSMDRAEGAFEAGD